VVVLGISISGAYSLHSNKINLEMNSIRMSDEGFYSIKSGDKIEEEDGMEYSSTYGTEWTKRNSNEDEDEEIGEEHAYELENVVNGMSDEAADLDETEDNRGVSMYETEEVYDSNRDNMQEPDNGDDSAIQQQPDNGDDSTMRHMDGGDSSKTRGAMQQHMDGEDDSAIQQQEWVPKGDDAQDQKKNVKLLIKLAKHKLKYFSHFTAKLAKKIKKDS